MIHHKIRGFHRLLACAGTLLPIVAPPPPASATITLSDLFADHMVLQRDAAVKVWGDGDPGGRIAVEVDRAPPVRGETTVGGDGHWSVQLPPMPAGGPYVVRVTDGSNTVVLHDVLVGDVWVAAGQSNMAFRMAPQLPWTLGVLDYPKELAAATEERVRFYTAVNESYLKPEPASHGLWEPCTPATARDFSAVAYYFARRVSTDADVPVGVLVTAVGSTSIKSWMDADALAAVEGRGELDTSAAKLAAAGGDEAYRRSMVGYRAGVRRSLPVDGPPPPFKEPYPGHQFQPTGFYNGMVAPLQRFPVKGVIWYQGESDATHAGQYPALFAHLVEQWRRQWGEPDLPVYFVQLPNFDPAGEKVKGRAPEQADRLRGTWAAMREAQADCLRVPHTGMAVTIDVGSPDLIHPRDKRPVGDRLALLALAKTYAQPVIATAASLESATADGERLILKFDGPIKQTFAPMRGFEVAGADGAYHPATASEDGTGGGLVLTSPDVPAPTAARYAWSDVPAVSLFSPGGLPFAPFRTDRTR